MSKSELKHLDPMSQVKTLILFLLFAIDFGSSMKAPWDRPTPLYNSSDPIALLDSNSLKPTVLNSDQAWLVEFYSSWCGHCQHFAPTFRELADKVKGWNSVIKVGAIDCADDKNMPACRDFDIMGYPSLKLIPPRAKDEKLGTFESVNDKTVQTIKMDMINFVTKLEMNSSFAPYVKKWPLLLPFRSEDVSLLWHESDSPHAIIIYDEDRSALSLEMAMNLSSVMTSLPTTLPFRRVLKNEAPNKLLLTLNLVERNLTPQIFAIKKDSMEVINLTPASEGKSDLSRIVLDFISKNILNKQSDNDDDRIESAEKRKMGLEDKIILDQNLIKHNPEMVHTESDIKKRRYTVFMADLEKTILYSLSHEIAQHQILAGDRLSALQDYVEVLVNYFPARHRTKRFLEEIRTWIVGHDDAIRGEDLQKQVEIVRQKESSFDDLPPDWIGCKGSAPQFGGYPCGLWSLFHTLTVNYAKIKGRSVSGAESRTILKTMATFIEEFFSCRDCARHFKQTHEDGKQIENEIQNVDDSILWLWKTHNRVNLRLSGDITDDNAYPKEKFPNQEHCSDCYSSRIGGTDLWTEFKLKNVLIFLKGLYGQDGINMSQLIISDKEDKIYVQGKETHDLVRVESSDAVPAARERLVYGKKKERVDKFNYNRDQNDGTTWSLFSTTDLSLCFSVYFVSAIILILVYIKFVAKGRYSSFFSSFCPRSRSNSHSNPLLGKV